VLLTGFLPVLRIAAYVVVITAMFQLAPLNERYRNAEIFGFLTIVGDFNIMFSICSIFATYHELNGHSELVASMDEKLSGRWSALFRIELTGKIIVAFCVLIPIMVVMLAEANADLLSVIATVGSTLVKGALDLLYVVYMKQTLALFEKE